MLDATFRSMWFLAAALVIAAVSLPGAAAFAGEGELDGRLGGAVSTFTERYGEPLPDSGASGNLYAVDGFGTVTVQFNRSGGEPRPDDPALLIVLSASRPASWPALEPHAGDWPLDVAEERALRFLPTDAILGDAVVDGEGHATASCRSDALERRFGVLSLGTCAVTYLQPAPDLVSYVTLSLTAGVDPSLHAEPALDESGCDGVVAWSRMTGERLSRAQTLLQEAGGIDPDAEDALARLGELAAGMRALAKEQREEAAPAAAATANYYVISALAGYASAIRLAADATAAGDGATMERAVTAIERANAAVTSATEEIQLAVELCGLVVEPASAAAASPTASP